MRLRAFSLVKNERPHSGEMADAQTEQARVIIAALKAHGRPAARFVAILWWVDSQLADNFSLDNDSAVRFHDIHLIVDNALLQVEATTDNERRFMEIAIAEARKRMGEDDRAHLKVGAVVVKAGAVVATAFRGELGKGEHAEYTALEKHQSNHDKSTVDTARLKNPQLAFNALAIKIGSAPRTVKE